MSGSRLVALVLLLTAIVAGVGCTPEPEAVAPSDIVQEVRVFARDNEFAPSQIKVKALRGVRLLITSFDREYLVHVPGLGIGLTRVPANETAIINFTPATLGAFDLREMEIRDMKSTIVVQACPPEAELENPVPATQESIAAGSVLYAGLCASCHGRGGRGDGPGAQNAGLQPADLTQPFMNRVSDGEFFWIITNGWYGMPSFQDRLAEEERWHLVNYLRALSSDR